MNYQICEKALTRTLQRWGRKIRSGFFKQAYVWKAVCADGLTVTNTCRLDWGWYELTNREVRRIRGGLPELQKALRRTAKACGFKGKLITPDGWEKLGVRF